MGRFDASLLAGLLMKLVVNVVAVALGCWLELVNCSSSEWEWIHPLWTGCGVSAVEVSCYESYLELVNYCKYLGHQRGC